MEKIANTNPAASTGSRAVCPWCCGESAREGSGHASCNVQSQIAALPSTTKPAFLCLDSCIWYLDPTVPHAMLGRRLSKLLRVSCHASCRLRVACSSMQAACQCSGPGSVHDTYNKLIVGAGYTPSVRHTKQSLPHRHHQGLQPSQAMTERACAQAPAALERQGHPLGRQPPSSAAVHSPTWCHAQVKIKSAHHSSSQSTRSTGSDP